MRGLKKDWNDISIIDKQFCEALERKDFGSVDQLVSAGANVKVRFGRKINDTPMHYFVYDFDIVKKLIDVGAYVDPLNKHFETPLHYTILYNSPASVVRLLLQNGANPHVQDRYDHTPIYDAIGKYHKKEHIIALLSRRVNVNVRVGHQRNTALNHALDRGLHKFIIKYMALYGYDLTRHLKEIRNNSNSDEIISFWIDCNDEFRLLQGENINTTPLANLLKLTELDELIIEPNHRAMSKFQTGVFTTNFPIYSEMVAEKFNYFVKRRSDLLTRLDCVRLISSSGARVELNKHCKRHMATFLGDKDLTKLILSSVLSNQTGASSDTV